MTDKQLLRKTYALYLNNTDIGAESVGLAIDDFYNHFNPQNKEDINKQLAKQLSRLSDIGYLAINIQQEPFYCKYITFSPLMFYDMRQTKDKIISGILTIIAGLSGTLLGFVLNNSCKTQSETNKCAQPQTYYHTEYMPQNSKPNIISHIYFP